MTQKKLCKDCGQTRPIDEFHRNRRSRDGLAYYCKSCANERQEASRRRRGMQRQKKASFEVPEGLKWCPDCGEVKPLADFPKTPRSRTGVHTYCKPCHNARGRASVAKVGGSRHYHLRRRYGIGIAEFQALLAEQGGVCAICGAANPQHVDHDHRFGNVRGILCFNCNGGLGQFRDNLEYLRKAITYLEGTAWQRVLIAPGVYRLSSPTRAVRRSPIS